MNPILKPEEQAVFDLRKLYQNFGYTSYKMSRFEEYDLYVRSKDFLQSQQVITFADRSGKLLGIGWLRDEELLAVASVVPGAGERVMKTLLTAASEDRVTLDVASTNTRAIALYERLGFVTVGERCRWYHIT